MAEACRLRASSAAQCARAPTAQPIAVDGGLSEWEKIAAIVPDKAEFSRNDSGKWAGSQDCSGSMRMCWDSDFLYLAFDVTDDVFNQPFTGGEIWAGDCVQFAFDRLEERTKGKYAPTSRNTPSRSRRKARCSGVPARPVR
jgi:hypothetical protein